MPKKNWQILEENKTLREKIAKECGITAVTAQILINRGITEPSAANNFLNSDINSLYDPHLMKDMEKAVLRIKKAISKGEKVMVYGDYDVDGISAAALLKRVLQDIGCNVISYIPHRVEEGYGLNREAVKIAHNRGISLLITVDCGISGKKEVDYLNKLGITTIVTDHHKIVEESFPDNAYAVINPLQKDCRYPFKYLSGVAVAYKLAQALTHGYGYDIEAHLDLVALGTIQDMVPQLDENRVLTKCGLSKINESKKKGILALIDVAGLKGKTISSRQIGYMLGPRINAAGRVSSADLALRLLVTDDEDEAVELAGVLDTENRNRQKIEGTILTEAVNRVESQINFKDDKVIVLDSDEWHPGVIGIVASRIAEKFCRPTIMISFNKNEGKGSGRSIKNFHLFDALSECRDFLSGFGGHADACGIKISRRNLDDFRFKFNDVASKMLAVGDFMPSLRIDMEIPLRLLKRDVVLEIENLSPYGPGNPRPILLSKGLKLKSKPTFMRREGIKMWVTDGNITCEAIGFGLNEMVDDIMESASFDVAYTPSINRWRDADTLQMEIVDLKANLI
ncbi:MAG: single-stranded-DNA-specific exonuclease RecJ [Candidatus Omnitrophota bacterium]|nr:single-stranded-DNA-specific exonuclease RecJ [Candidatus Omnitrophota bacterium]